MELGLRRANRIEAAVPAPPAGGPAPARPAAKAVLPPDPESVARAWYAEEHGSERRYFEDYRRRTLVVRATATSISTRREDLATIRTMLDLAAARDWQALQLGGSAAFRREAWIEAAARGLEARGHDPSAPERQEAARRRAERAPAGGPRAAAPAGHAVVPSREEEVARQEKAASGPANHHRSVREARRDLSPDGRLVLEALSEKIDRQMHRHALAARAELKAFVAGELVRREQAEGPVVLSPAQRRAAAAPEPARPATVARREPEEPRPTLVR